MAFNTTYPSDFTRLGGQFSGTGIPDVNVLPVGTVSIPLYGSYYGGDNPADPGPHSYASAVDHWQIRDYTGAVVASGGAIAAGQDFVIPELRSDGTTPLRGAPGWYHVYLYRADGTYMGGGMFVLEPAGSPWPTGAEYFGARLGLPGGRMSLGNAADPGADPGNFGTGWWGGGATPSLAPSPDAAAAAVGQPSMWDTVDPVRKANLINLVNFTYYSYTPPAGTIAYNPADAQQAGVRATAARYAGKGFIYEGRNEPAPSAAYARDTVAFARAVWDGDPAARVAVVAPVTFNRALIGNLAAYFAALMGLLTTGEKAKLVISFHDYNTVYDSLLLGDECWAAWNALLESFGLDGHMKVISEQDGFEAAHYGAGDLVRQAVRYSTSNMLSQANGVERERQFLYYLRQHGHDSYYFWHLSESGQPHPVIAWEMTQERETRRAVFVERHDAGADSRTVLSLRYQRADGTGVVQAKACGRSSAPVVYQLAGDNLPSTLTTVDFQGRTATVPCDGDTVAVTLTALPTFLRLPAGVTATLAPLVRASFPETGFISSQPGYGAAPSPVNAGTSRESFAFDDSSPDGDVKFAWRGQAPFASGEWVGVKVLVPFVLTGVAVYCPIPSHEVSTIIQADLEVRVGGEWVPATKGGQPVVIDEDTPYQLVASNAQDGVQGWYFGYDVGAHAWHLDVDDVTCTGWRLVVHEVTAGESPSMETYTAAPGPFASDTSGDHAGFGTETPYLYVSGLYTEGTALPTGVPSTSPRYLVKGTGAPPVLSGTVTELVGETV